MKKLINWFLGKKCVYQEPGKYKIFYDKSSNQYTTSIDKKFNGDCLLLYQESVNKLGELTK